MILSLKKPPRVMRQLQRRPLKVVKQPQMRKPREKRLIRTTRPLKMMSTRTRRPRKLPTLKISQKISQKKRSLTRRTRIPRKRLMETKPMTKANHLPLTQVKLRKMHPTLFSNKVLIRNSVRFF